MKDIRCNVCNDNIYKLIMCDVCYNYYCYKCIRANWSLCPGCNSIMKEVEDIRTTIMFSEKL